MLQPSKTKYRKEFRGKMRGHSKGNLVVFGEYGLKAMGCSWFTANQIEAARRAITHSTKRTARVCIRIFPDKPITKHGDGTMGAGKGDVKGYVAVVKPGRIVFEISGVAEAEARIALKLAAAKLPVHCKIVTKK